MGEIRRQEGVICVVLNVLPCAKDSCDPSHDHPATYIISTLSIYIYILLFTIHCHHPYAISKLIYH